MKVTIKAPKPKLVNKFKLTVVSMGGDADYYHTTITLFDKVQGELFELHKLLKSQIKIAKKGLSGGDCEKLEEKAIKYILNNQILRAIAVGEEKYADDHATEYFSNIFRVGKFGDNYWAPEEMSVTYLNENGDECDVTIED